MDGTTIGVICTALFTLIQAVVLAWFQYNQKTKDKMTDLKIEEVKEENERRSKRRNDNSNKVFGELWNVLTELDADRVYIVQPHPLGNESMLSIYYEVKRKGVEPMKPQVQNLSIASVAKFSNDLVSSDFSYIEDLNSVSDKYARSILSSCGCQSAIVKRLSDNQHDWVGSIFVEYTNGQMPGIEECNKMMLEASNNIQFILPEIK